MSELSVATASRPRVTLTESAASRVQTLMEMEGNPGLMLRISISGGGCSGFQYGFSLDDTSTDADALFEQHGVKMVIDDVSLEMLNGAEVDFVEDLVGSAFAIRNPNASSTCGCGTSFSV